MTAQRLAHELNSLLDGSMRCVRLAEQALSQDSAVDPQVIEQALERLRTAQRAMTDMASLLHRAMAGGTSVESLRQDRTLAEAVRRALETVGPLAAEAGVLVSVDMADAVAALPAGPLGTVMINGLRNAIAACAEPGVQFRRVELTVVIARDGGELSILIADTGGGLAETHAPPKPGGHGIGLEVCHDVAAELGGRCELSNLPYGDGAVLHVVIPLRSLKAA